MDIPVYLLILSGFFLTSFFLHKYNNLQLFENNQHFLVYVAIIFLIGVVWDYFSVSQQIWTFPGNGIVGLRIGILPIEEYLFFLIMPYFGLTLHRTLGKKFKK